MEASTRRYSRYTVMFHFLSRVLVYIYTYLTQTTIKKENIPSSQKVPCDPSQSMPDPTYFKRQSVF